MSSKRSPILSHSPDWRLALSGTLSFLALAAALVSQHGFGMAPCAWCVIQRFLFALIGLVCLVSFLPHMTLRVSASNGIWLTTSGAWFTRRGMRVAAGTGALVAGLGAWAAYYQASVAANLDTCSRTAADLLVSGSRLDEYLPWLFGIYASCADASMPLFGVPYPYYSLALFGVLGGLLLSVVLGSDRWASGTPCPGV